MISFEKLRSITKDLKTFGLTEKNASEILKCIDSAQTYLRSQFGHKISLESHTASHCALFSVSDPTDPTLKHICSVPHNESCESCDLMVNIVQALEGVIYVAKGNDMGTEAYNEFLFDLREAHKKIWAYKCQILRAYVQSRFWDDLMSRKEEDVVFITLDYAMKW